MILRDVINNAIIYLGYADKIDLNDKSVTEKNCPEVKMLVRCANLVYGELLSQYLPIYKTKKVNFTNGFCSYRVLDNQIIDVVTVKMDSTNIKYQLDAKGIYCDVPYAEIKYSYMPNFLNLDSVVEIDARLTNRVFALGICSEFCLIHNLFEESLAFEKRYKDSLKELLRKKGEIKVKARGWY